MQLCVTCNGQGFLMKSDGQPCPMCSMPEIQIGGSGWLKDDGLPMSLEEIWDLGRLPDPAATLKLDLQVDGDQWCVLYGSDLVVGISGFGDTPNNAVADFNARWKKAFEKPRMATDDERRARGVAV